MTKIIHMKTVYTVVVKTKILLIEHFLIAYCVYIFSITVPLPLELYYTILTIS